ncbi:hypothetical protein V2J09_000380 [Rumex salicifolius]
MRSNDSSPSLSQTTCGSLLVELQKIWDEIGETDTERDKMLLQLEQECLDIYRRKVNSTRKNKMDLTQVLDESEAEINRLISALGDQTYWKKTKGTLREQLSAVKPVLEDLRLKKEQRVKEFSQTQSQINDICAEIAGNDQYINDAEPKIEELDLTTKRLGELKLQLEELRKEKVLRLQKVNNHVSAIHELSAVMSKDFKKLLNGVHPSLADHAFGQFKSISNDTLCKLLGMVDSLRQEKQSRLQKIQNLGIALVDMWNLLDTPINDQRRFGDIISLVSSSVDEVSRHGCLSPEAIEYTEIEVERLNVLKSNKMKELILKRQHELEEVYREVHMELDKDSSRENLTSLIESGKVDLSDLFSSMDDQIRNAKEQAHSRTDILDKVDKWRHACEEEIWLDEYEKDHNRYSAGRGAHKMLKRAEKARNLVGKISSLMDNLISRVKTWEAEKGMTFFYDKTPLLNILEEYILHRQQREEEKRRSREQKRLQEQIAVEKEALFGSKPVIKKPLGLNNSSNNNALNGTPIARHMATPTASKRLGISGSRGRRDSARVISPVNYVALSKEDSMPYGN